MVESFDELFMDATTPSSRRRARHRARGLGATRDPVFLRAVELPGLNRVSDDALAVRD